MKVVISVAATVIGLATIATRTTDAVDWSLIPTTVVAFWMWAAIPSFPRPVLYLLGISTPFVLNIIESESEVSMFLVVLTIAVAAAFEDVRPLAVTATLIAVAAVISLTLTGVLGDFAMPNWLFGFAFSWGAGALAYRYANAIDELEEARVIVADQAAVHERRRIARDVHDLVGHSLSVMMLHITGARLLMHKDPQEAERALEQAEAAGRESLAEIRRTVGLLRDDADSAEASLPSPDLTDVTELVDEFVLAGIDARLDVEGTVEKVEGAAALAGYRIIQEALTNASRHTVGAQVLVSLDVAGATYDLVVRNTGGHETGAAKGSGFGLISMRERAKSVGGSLVAGPIANGWTVEATLPTRSQETAA